MYHKISTRIAGHLRKFIGQFLERWTTLCIKHPACKIWDQSLNHLPNHKLINQSIKQSTNMKDLIKHFGIHKAAAAMMSTAWRKTAVTPVHWQWELLQSCIKPRCNSFLTYFDLVLRILHTSDIICSWQKQYTLHHHIHFEITVLSMSHPIGL